jgi:uncharacterized protein
VPRADETSKKHVEPFLTNLMNWLPSAPEKIEFWGGEPLVYLKTLVPLAEALRARYPDAQFGMITNGSLLTPKINQWLYDLGFSVSISHDGPGQHVRGPDPLEDPKQRAGIMGLYVLMRPEGRISFNSMVHRENLDREAIQRFFVNLTGDDDVPIGEGAVIDAYDAAAINQGLKSSKEQVYLRRATIDQLRHGKIMNFSLVHSRMGEWLDSLAHKRSAEILGMKCGMDRTDTITVDLMGNVVTCQNVSAVSDAPNGESHKIGHVDYYASISMKSSTHCMFLEGENWWRSCDNSFSDNVAFFAYAIELVTGYLPYRIEGGDLPEARRDIWGSDLGEILLAKRKVIPIKVTV